MNLEEEFNKKLKVIHAQSSYVPSDFKTDERHIKQYLACKIGEELLKNDLIDFKCELNDEYTNKIKAVFAFITKKDLKEIINKFKNKE